MQMNTSTSVETIPWIHQPMLFAERRAQLWAPPQAPVFLSIEKGTI